MKGTITNQFTTRASLNLEMALLIMLLALAVVFGLEIVGSSINDTYAEAAGMFGIAGGISGPADTTQTDNGDGTWTIGWDGGTPPFTIIEDGTPIDTDDVSPYIYTPTPGEHEIIIEDGDGNQSEPVVILVDTLTLTEHSTNPSYSPGMITINGAQLNGSPVVIESLDGTWTFVGTKTSTAQGVIATLECLDGDFTQVQVKGGIKFLRYTWSLPRNSATDLHAVVGVAGLYPDISMITVWMEL